MPPIDPTSLLLEKAAGQGIVVLLLITGIVVVGRMLRTSIADRVTDLKERIGALETAVKECERDRAALWREIRPDAP